MSHLRITCAPFTPIVDMDINRRLNLNWRYGLKVKKLTSSKRRRTKVAALSGSASSRCPQNFNRKLLRVAATLAWRRDRPGPDENASCRSIAKPGASYRLGPAKPN
jgi:hypothetical protein